MSRKSKTPHDDMTVQAKDCEDFVLVPKSLVENLKKKLDFRNREPPHCPTCSCGMPHPTPSAPEPS